MGGPLGGTAEYGIARKSGDNRFGPGEQSVKIYRLILNLVKTHDLTKAPLEESSTREVLSSLYHCLHNIFSITISKYVL